jgi:hypothetical protein
VHEVRNDQAGADAWGRAMTELHLPTRAALDGVSSSGPPPRRPPPPPQYVPRRPIHQPDGVPDPYDGLAYRGPPRPDPRRDADEPDDVEAGRVEGDEAHGHGRCDKLRPGQTSREQRCNARRDGGAQQQKGAGMACGRRLRVRAASEKFQDAPVVRQERS